MLELRTPRLEDEQPLREADREFSEEGNEFRFASGLAEAQCFARYLEQLGRWSQGHDLPTGYVPWTLLIGVVSDEVVGCVSLRHCLTDALRNIGGHIGYGVVRSKRRMGYGTEMLRQALAYCEELGVDRALVTCDVDNIGSMKVIERNGGVLASTSDDPNLTVQKHRYWVPTDSSV